MLSTLLFHQETLNCATSHGGKILHFLTYQLLSYKKLFSAFAEADTSSNGYQVADHVDYSAQNLGSMLDRGQPFLG